MTFEDWFKLITADERWLEGVTKNSEGLSRFKKCAEKIYLGYLADGVSSIKFKDVGEMRRHVMNAFFKTVPEKTNWVIQQPEEKKEISEPPLTGEARAKRLAEWEAVVQGVGNNQRPFIDGQIEEEGQDRPKKKKGVVYPITPEEKIIENALHVRYLRENYDSKSMDKLPGWKSESDWKLKQQENEDS